MGPARVADGEAPDVRRLLALAPDPIDSRIGVGEIADRWLFLAERFRAFEMRLNLRHDAARLAERHRAVTPQSGPPVNNRYRIEGRYGGEANLRALHYPHYDF